MQDVDDSMFYKKGVERRRYHIQIFNDKGALPLLKVSDLWSEVPQHFEVGDILTGTCDKCGAENNVCRIPDD